MSTIGPATSSAPKQARDSFLVRDLAFQVGPLAEKDVPDQMASLLQNLPERRAIVTWEDKAGNYYLQTIPYSPGLSRDPAPTADLTPLTVSFKRNGEVVTLPVIADPRRERN
jgi:hypothetical protein